MTRSPFSKSSTRKNSSGAFPIAQFLILGTVIIIFAAVFVQNLQPLVQVFFLGQKTLPIPLSVAMLVAFVIGSLIAFVINAIASYQQNIAIRRAVAAGSQTPESTKEVKQPLEPNNFTSNYQSPNSPNSQTKTVPEFRDDEQEYEEEYEDDWEDETDDWEGEEEYEDEDPDTVPYGDRKNLKSAQPNREKRDRPPLDARYIR